ncbi:DNA polymerase III subunit beta [Spiribacter roseus]|jgi:DNA polymerase-3 subunit beta|uniref:Beta sliding clamp n=1 Tax=Spiribacter roseus TaxID=1855875 RepID=A0ABV3RYD9_9GAMM|nr:DNA polymerase III subunit beta [Spiribacter roseus]KAF0283952.1 DNA polymerase III subunit beta [Spiribacter roseus]
MEFQIERATLLRPLQAIIGVVERRQTLPILANVLIEKTDDRLCLTATDLEVELKTDTPLEGGQPGQVTVPARKLMDIVRNLPDDAVVNLRQEQERIVVKAGPSRFSLATLPAEDFPTADDVEPAQRFSLPQSQLKWLIEKSHFAMALQDVRYYLNGLLLELEPRQLRAVATDGHRLALAAVPSTEEAVETTQVIVPRKGIQEMLRLLDDDEEPVELDLGPGHIQVTLSGIRFTSKLIDGRFPDYQRVIPAEEGSFAVVDRETLRKALVRASILSNEKYRGVRFGFEADQLRIQSNNPEQEEAEEQVPASFNGEAMEIGFNASYMLDALAAIDENTVQLYVRDANSSALILGETLRDARYVVMPMRL